MRKSIAAVSLAAASVAGLGVGFTLGVPGISSAQTATTTAPASGATGTATPGANRAVRVSDALKPLVTDGTITQAQADKVAAALQNAMPAGRGFGHGGAGKRMGGGNLSVVAKTIGITDADLRTALQGGQTIAQVAQGHNVTADAVIAALQADLQTRLDKGVAAGTITQAQADQRKASAATKFADLVNNAHPKAHGAKSGSGGRGSAATTPPTTTA